MLNALSYVILLLALSVCSPFCEAAAQTANSARWPDDDRRQGYVFCFEEMTENQGLDTIQADRFCNCYVAQMEQAYTSYAALTEFAQADPKAYGKQFARWWQICQRQAAQPAAEKRNNVVNWTKQDREYIAGTIAKTALERGSDSVAAASIGNCILAQIIEAYPNKSDYLNLLKNEPDTARVETNAFMEVCVLLLGPPDSAEAWDVASGWSDYFRNSVIAECEQAVAESVDAKPGKARKACACLAAELEAAEPSGIKAAKQKRDTSPKFMEAVSAAYKVCLTKYGFRYPLTR